MQINNNSISWASKKQPIVALSTAEAEYYAAATGAQELDWIRQLLEEIFIKNLKLKGKYELLIDNKSTINITKNPSMHGKTKHIDIKYHYLKELVQNKILHPRYIRTDEQLADILTKPLNKNLFNKFRDRILNRNYGISKNKSQGNP